MRFCFRRHGLCGNRQRAFHTCRRQFLFRAVGREHLSPANRVTGIAGDSHGILWISTLGGLKSFNPLTGKVGSFRRSPAEQLLPIIMWLWWGRVSFLGTMTDGIVEYDVADGVFRPYIDVGCGVISSLSTDGKDLLYVNRRKRRSFHFRVCQSDSPLFPPRYKRRSGHPFQFGLFGAGRPRRAALDRFLPAWRGLQPLSQPSFFKSIASARVSQPKGCPSGRFRFTGSRS